MSDIRKRISPRRPFSLTPAGLRRIVLGVVGTGEGGAAALSVQGGKPAAKPLRLTQPPTGYMLVAAHSQRGVLDAHAYQAIAAAALLAGAETAVIALVFGTLEEDLGDYGADLVAAIPGLGGDAWSPEPELAYMRDFIARYAPRHVILPDNEVGDGDLGRRLAVDMGADIATRVVELRAGAVARYWQGGAQMARGPMPRIVLIAPETVETDLPFRGAAAPLDYDVVMPPAGPYTNLGQRETPAAQLALDEADIIVAAGNGVEDVRTFEAVAAGLGAAVGASRVAVDAGRFTRDKQIGATGKTVKASVYIAIGISGAVQHLQGIKACRHVIAINRDASAPIVKRANLTIVGNAQEVMTALLAALRQGEPLNTMQVKS